MRDRPGAAVRFLVATTFLWAVSFPLIRALSLVQHARAPEFNSCFVSSVVVVLRFALGGAVLAALSPGSLRGVRASPSSV